MEQQLSKTAFFFKGCVSVLEWKNPTSSRGHWCGSGTHDGCHQDRADPPGLSAPGIMSCPVPGRTVLLKTDVGKAGLKPKVHHSIMSSHQEKPGLSRPTDSKVNADCVWKVVSLASPAGAHPAPSIKSYSVSVTMATTFWFREYCW